MDIVVTGANGLLGQHLIQFLLRNGHRVMALAKGEERISFPGVPSYSYHSLDIRDKDAMDRFFSTVHFADAVIHAAALTQVDYCEQHREEAFEVNVVATQNLLQLAQARYGHFIYVSTDFVFDGKRGNYREEDPRAPVNYYGETKMLAEDLVNAAACPWTIARTCLVYGNTLYGTRSNIISWVKENLENGRPIRVVSDQVRTPTYVRDLARGIMLLAEKRAEGIFHLSGKDIITPYEMACVAADFFGLDKGLMEKVDGKVFTQPARRPLHTGFDITKARTMLGFEPLHFKEGIASMYAGWKETE